MKNLFLISTLVLVFFSTNLFAASTTQRCLETLSDNFEDEAKHYRLDLASYDIKDYRKDYVSESFKIVRILLDEIGCSANSIKFNQGPMGTGRSRCRQLVPKLEVSRVCFVQTNLGYFILSQDYLEGVNVVYSRWD